MLLCLSIRTWVCAGCYSVAIVRVSPIAFQCVAVSIKFSSGVPMYPASTRWVAQWYPSVRDIYIPRVGVAMTVCWMMIFFYFFPAWFHMYISIV